MRIKVKLWLRKKKRKKEKKNPEVSTVTLKGRKLVPRCGEPREGGRSGVPQQRPVPAAALPLPAAPSRLFALFPASRQRFCQLRIDSYFV